MERRDQIYAVLALTLLVGWMSIGCTPGTLGALLLPFSDDKVEPKCKLASKDKKKEVTVVIVCNTTATITRPDLIGADQDLADRLNTTLTKNFKDNKEKVKIVAPSRVRTYQNKLTARGAVSDQEIGKHFKADYVIAIDVANVDLYAERTIQLFRGKIDLSVRTLDLSKPKGEGQEIFEESYSLTYPPHGPIDASGSTPAQFRSLFLGRVARDLARMFSAVPHDKAMDMD